MRFWPFKRKPTPLPAPAESRKTEPRETFESVALGGKAGVVARSGAPFPFNKIMPYDATGGEKLSRGYEQSAWVQRAIKKIAGPIAAVSLDFSLNGEAYDDPDLAAFWDCPAVRMSRHDFIEATVGWLKLEGECFWLLDDSSLLPYYMLVAESCIPTGQKIAHAISAVLRNQTGKPLQAAFNWDEHPVIQAVRRERWDTAQKMFAMGVPLKEINDNLDLRLPEIPGWETGYLPATLVPVGTPPPEENDDYAELPTADDSLDKMKRLLDPLQRAKRFLLNPVNPVKNIIDENPDGCCSRLASAGLALRVANDREMALWRSLQTQRAATRNAILSKIGKVLMEARAEVKAKLERYSAKMPETKAVAADFMFDLGQFVGKLTAALRPIQAAALQSAGEELYEEIGQDKSAFTYPPHDALRFLDSRKNPLAGASDEIWQSVQGTIHDGLVSGDSIADLQDAVSAKFNEISKGRAKTIAITETGMAHEDARDIAMKSAGIKWKRWLTSGNANVRPAHEEADGQVVAVHDSFEVGGEKLRFPCDPSGSAGNVINCHCVSVPDRDGPTQDKL